jgi:hypothetical protein
MVESLGEALLRTHAQMLFSALVISGLSATLVDCLSAISRIPSGTYSLKAQLVLMNMISHV